MPKKLLEGSPLANSAEEMRFSDILAAIAEDETVKESIEEIKTYGSLETEDFRRRYKDNVEMLTDHSVFVGTVEASELEESEWVTLAGVFYKRAFDAENLKTELPAVMKETFGIDKLTQKETLAILSCSQASFEEDMLKPLKGKNPEENKREFTIALVTAKLQGYPVEDTVLADFAKASEKELEVFSDSLDKIYDRTDVYLDLALEKADEIEAEMASDDELTGVVNDEDIAALKEEEAFFNKQDFIRNVAITENEYAENPAQYGEGVFIPNNDFSIPPLGDIEHREFEFPTTSQIRFGWRAVSDWKDKDFDKGKDNDELIYNDASAKEVRASNLVVDDVRNQKVTLDMLKNELFNLSFGCVSKDEVASVIEYNKASMLAGMFGSGDPRRAFRCFLDQEALKNGVYRFDPEKTKPFTDMFADANREKLTTEVTSTLPVRNRAGDTLRNILRVNVTEDVTENCSMSEAVDAYRERHGEDAEIPLTDAQKVSVARTVLNMREIRASRSFLWHLKHPIDSVREYFQIVGAKRTATNVLGIPAEDFDLTTGRQRLDEKSEQIAIAKAEEERRRKEEKQRQAEQKAKEAAEKKAKKEKEAAEKKKAAENVKEPVKEEVKEPVKEEVKEPQPNPNADREPMDVDLSEKQPEKEPLVKEGPKEPVKEAEINNA